MPTEETLITQAQRGDMSAFESLVQKYDRKVLAMAVSYLRDPDDAKDAYQEIFLRVYRGLPGFQRRSQFSTWLYRITANVCKTHSSRSSRHEHVSLDSSIERQHGRQQPLVESLEGSEAADQRALKHDLRRQMEEAMTLLSPRQRLVFTMRHYQGHKLREIADILECAEGTVKRHLFTATRRLRDSLAPVAKEEWGL